MKWGVLSLFIFFENENVIFPAVFCVPVTCQLFSCELCPARKKNTRRAERSRTDLKHSHEEREREEGGAKYPKAQLTGAKDEAEKQQREAMRDSGVEGVRGRRSGGDQQRSSPSVRDGVAKKKEEGRTSNRGSPGWGSVAAAGGGRHIPSLGRGGRVVPSSGSRPFAEGFPVPLSVGGGS